MSAQLALMLGEGGSGGPSSAAGAWSASQGVTWSGPLQIPMIYVTLTNTSTARAAEANQTFASLGLRVDPFVVQRHPRGSVVGIFKSHVEALRHMTQVANKSSSPLFAIFEDDAQPTRFNTPETMETIVKELVSTQDDFDIAYLGSIQWFQLMPWMAPWSRHTLHTLNHAWSTMHANIYSRRGLANVLPWLEARLALMEGDPNSTPDHVDLYLEHSSPQIDRRQVVPYMFDQDWEIPSGNVDRCGAAEIDCKSGEQDFEQAYLRAGRHVDWSNTCFEIGGSPERFYLIFIPLLLLLVGSTAYVCLACYRGRRCCFKWCAPESDGATKAKPTESSTLLVKEG